MNPPLSLLPTNLVGKIGDKMKASVDPAPSSRQGREDETLAQGGRSGHSSRPHNAQVEAEERSPSRHSICPAWHHPISVQYSG
jgi:hypothetical protein